MSSLTDYDLYLWVNIATEFYLEPEEVSVAIRKAYIVLDGHVGCHIPKCFYRSLDGDDIVVLVVTPDYKVVAEIAI